MPIAQRLRTEFGTDNNYWRVLRVLLDIEGATATVHLAGWIDEDAWLAGSSPQSTRIFVFADPDSSPFLQPAEGVNTEDIAVRAILSTNDFTGGQTIAPNLPPAP